MAKRILFQGDSITDCGRNRSDFYGMGTGYPLLVKAALGLDCPNEYEIINRGISGNRIVDLYARIKADFINLKPDYASILIGVNDVWHEIGSQNGVDTEKFEKIYDMLLSEVKEELPNIKIILLGAFVTRSSATEEYWNVFEPEVRKRIEITKRLAEKYGCAFVDVQEMFDEAIARKPEPFWTQEGVHPTEAGHEIMKRAWFKGFLSL